MSPRWTAVKAWRHSLRDDVDAAPPSGLSRPGIGLAVARSLDELTDRALDAVASMPGDPFPSAALVTARTVPTAALEWLAVLLGHGTEVVWKVPEDVPGLSGWVLAHARAFDLPLTVTSDRRAVSRHPLVIAMGSDDTIAALDRSATDNLFDALTRVSGRRADAPARVLGFGHRASFAWWGGDADPVAAADALALDVATHDTRGCMSPAIVFTDDVDTVLRVLPERMDAAQVAWPRGDLSQVEHARIRERDVLAQVRGHTVKGHAWRIHEVAPPDAVHAALPRCVQVVGVDDVHAAARRLRPLAHRISSVGTTPDTDPRPWRALDVPRLCPLGTMQAPPLLRRHDGVDHLRRILR